MRSLTPEKGEADYERCWIRRSAGGRVRSEPHVRSVTIEDIFLPDRVRSRQSFPGRILIVVGQVSRGGGLDRARYDACHTMTLP
jgi:hypothetical protein